jgi:LPXTG-motif cell wall-anchored protein
MKIKSLVLSSLSVLAIMFALMFSPNQANAQGADSMTVVSGMNTSFETAATPSGSLKDKVYGYYANGQFVVNGLVNDVVTKNGQQFTVYDPDGTGSTTLTVYTEKTSTGTTPAPTPKPESPSKNTGDTNTGDSTTPSKGKETSGQKETTNQKKTSDQKATSGQKETSKKETTTSQKEATQKATSGQKATSKETTSEKETNKAEKTNEKASSSKKEETEKVESDKYKEDKLPKTGDESTFPVKTTAGVLLIMVALVIGWSKRKAILKR